MSEEKLKNMEKGIYDMCDVFPKRKLGAQLKEFTSKEIEIVKIDGKGRGVKATGEIKNGEVIMVSEAYVSGPKEQDDEQFVEDIKAKFQTHPESQSRVFDLYAGERYEALKDQKSDSRIDEDRIRGIFKMNAFQGGDSRGIWILPAYVNHDCIDFNCDWKCFGNLYFLRATMNIQPGEELLVHYFNSTDTVEIRQERSNEHDFVCKCRLCEHQKHEVGKEKKDQILRNVESLTEKTDPTDIRMDIKWVKDWLEKYEQIGKDSGKPEWNFTLKILLQKLLKLYGKLEATEEELRDEKDTAVKYYKVMNECPQKDGSGRIVFSVAAGARVAEVCLKQKDRDEVKKWIQRIKEDLRVSFGDSNVFKSAFPKLHEQAAKLENEY